MMIFRFVKGPQYAQTALKFKLHSPYETFNICEK